MKIHHEYYHIDNEPEFSHAFTEIKKIDTKKPVLNNANNFTTTKPLHLDGALSIGGNSKTITLNSNGDPSKSAEGLLFSTSVVMNNLNLTAGQKMKDHLIEFNGNGTSLALSNSD